jgi:hypothetical protein
MKYLDPLTSVKGDMPFKISLFFFILVGLAGLEPATFRPPDGRATRLRHSPPIQLFLVIFIGRASEKDEI